MDAEAVGLATGPAQATPGAQTAVATLAAMDVVHGIAP